MIANFAPNCEPQLRDATGIGRITTGGLRRQALLPLFALLAQVTFAAAGGGGGLLASAAPDGLARTISQGVPARVSIGDEVLSFQQSSDNTFENIRGSLVTRIRYHRDPDYSALWYQIEFVNRGGQEVAGIKVDPFAVSVAVEPPTTIPRVRYVTGSQHYDATYPSRAFEVVDRAIMTPDHAKPIEIGGELSQEYVQMMQFAVQTGEKLAGFMVSFEWSAGWSIKAGYTKPVYQEAPPKQSEFEITAKLKLGELVVPAGATIELPRVHLVFFEGKDWTPLENNGRRYISDRIAYRQPKNAQVNKVTYDHWFGIQGNFDIEDMLRQARRAKELGCEFFCLDAGWYGKGAFGSSGKGVWDEPDPTKFPQGIADVQRLSALCTDSGMGFGLWSLLLVKNQAGKLEQGPEAAFDLTKPEGVNAALDVLRRWIKTYNLTWFRFEMLGQGELSYQRGYQEILATITREFPELHIECCLGGGTRFDLANMRYSTTTWLSDHTGSPDVCRVTQTGALRVWPSYMLNLAVRVHRNTGDSEATAYNVISRMPGTLSFNGDIAQWSVEATQRVRQLVDKYKTIRHLQSQPVFFPLPQVRKIEDWDVVCFGDGKGEAQLMYVFRVGGSSASFVQVPDAPGEWSLVMSSDPNVAIKASGNGFTLSQPERSAAVWIRKR
ncbi:MAG TPA: glycoside hydrolase family 36 protein [Opitutaceae bacterium]